MKKLFRFLAATALVAFAAACGQDGADPYNPTSGDTDVTFSVAAPGGVASRAVADGLKATELQWAIYLTGDLEKADMAPVQQGTATFVDRKTEVKVRLVAGKSYDIIFWAQNPACTDYKIDWTTKQLSITYNDVEEGNNEDRDAFFWVERNLKVNGAIEKDIWLYRPFAQLNIGISYSDINIALQHKYELAGTKVKASTHTALSFVAYKGTPGQPDYLPGAPTGEMKEVTFDWAAPVSKNQTADVEKLKLNDGSEYFWASFNYLLADTPTETTDVSAWFKYTTDDTAEPIGPFTWVNIERNHRTNIVGDLLTDPATFKVIIDNNFDEPAHEFIPWNGELEALPAAGADGYINIVTPGQFATLLADASGLKAKLGEDLDLGGYPVQVNAGLTRNLELDGQGHIVKGLAPKVESTANGLFPKLVSSTVKNLTVDGIVITPAAVRAEFEGDFYAGALVGATYGTVNLEKVTITGATVAGVNKVGGLVGFVAENVLNVDGCVVENSNVSTFSEEDGGNVGGLIGYVAPNATVKNSAVKNTKITAINAAGEAKRANSEFIGTYQGTKGTTLAIEAAVVEGNTFAETANGYVAPEYYKGLVGGMRYADGVVTIDGATAGEVVVTPEIVKVSVESLEFAAEGGEQTVEVELVGEAELQITKPEWVSINVAENVLTVVVAANEVTEELTGGIVLTYGESTKTIAVKQAAAEVVEPTATPISDIIAGGAGEYIAEGTVVASYQQGFILSDGTAEMMVYVGSNATIPAVGKTVKVEGSTSVYNGMLQFGAGATITETGEAEVKPSTPVALDGAAMNSLSYTTPTFVSFTGVYSADNTVAVEGATITVALSNPNADLGLAELNKYTLAFEAWYTGSYNTKAYFVVTSVKVVAEPEVEDPKVAPAKPTDVATVTEIDVNAQYTFVAVNTFEAGRWYALVAGDVAATAVTASYDYIRVVDAADLDSDGVVTLAGASAFTFEAVDGGYALKNADGKYYYMKGAYNNFNVGTSYAESYVWQVYATDTNAVEIFNVDKQKWIQYSTSYTSYGAYASEQSGAVLPVLYEVVAKVESTDPGTGEEGGEEGGKEAMLSFADKANRTIYTTSQQVWEQNGITVTNDKANSTSNVADYANPARFYKSSKITVEAPGMISQIVFDANSASYATALQSSITESDGGTVTVSSDKVTVAFAEPVASYTIASLSGGQVRLDAVTVIYLK